MSNSNDAEPKDDYPEHFHTKGRSPEPTFAGTELLFRAVKAWPVPGNDESALKDAFRDPDVSVNRQKFSEAFRVRHEFKRRRYPVVSMVYADVHGAVIKTEARKGQASVSSSIRVEHSPSSRNYSHTLIWHDAPQTGPGKSTLRTLFREYLRDRSKPELPPIGEHEVVENAIVKPASTAPVEPLPERDPLQQCRTKLGRSVFERAMRFLDWFWSSF